VADTCPYCSRPTTGDICSAHGYVGQTPVVPPAGTVPIGGIIFYEGTIADIPANWALCDGSRGTHNMSGLFVMGATSQGALGATGGSNADHSHGVTVDFSGSTSATTDAAGVSDHTLGGNVATSGPHGHTLSGSTDAPSDYHNLPTLGGGNTFSTGGHTHGLSGGAAASGGDHSHTAGWLTITGHGTHAHSVSGSCSGSGSAQTSGGGLGNAPSYYALAYIKRIS